MKPKTLSPSLSDRDKKWYNNRYREGMDVKGKILVLDDDVFIRESLTELLSYCGYLALASSRSSDALQIIEQEKNTLDVLIVDLLLPDMDGLSFIQEANRTIPEVPKIILTGFGTAEEAIKALKIGAFDFISKPITNYDEFLNIIDNALNKKRSFFTLREIFLSAQKIHSHLSPSAVPQTAHCSMGYFSTLIGDIGGDYWDHRKTSRGSDLFFLGDSFGKGVYAAFVTILAKMTFNSYLNMDGTPADILAKINESLHLSAPCEKYMTGIALEVCNDHVLISNAGNCPPLLCRAEDGSVSELLAPSQVFLNFQQNYSFKNEQSPFCTGDRIFLFSRGILRSTSMEGEEYGIDRMKEFVKTKKDVPLEELPPLLKKEIERFRQDEELTEDLTTIVIEKN